MRSFIQEKSSVRYVSNNLYVLGEPELFVQIYAQILLGVTFCALDRWEEVEISKSTRKISFSFMPVIVYDFGWT